MLGPTRRLITATPSLTRLSSRGMCKSLVSAGLTDAFLAVQAMERTGIEPVTSGLQIYADVRQGEHGATERAWLRGLARGRATPFDTVRRRSAATALSFS